MQSRNLKSPFPAIFFLAGRLDPILIRHRVRKVPVLTVHTETRKRRCVFGDSFHRIRVVSNKNEYVLTGPTLQFATSENNISELPLPLFKNESSCKTFKRKLVRFA